MLPESVWLLPHHRVHRRAHPRRGQEQDCPDRRCRDPRANWGQHPPGSDGISAAPTASRTATPRGSTCAASSASTAATTAVPAALRSSCGQRPRCDEFVSATVGGPLRDIDFYRFSGATYICRCCRKVRAVLRMHRSCGKQSEADKTKSVVWRDAHEIISFRLCCPGRPSSRRLDSRSELDAWPESVPVSPSWDPRWQSST